MSDKLLSLLESEQFNDALVEINRLLKEKPNDARLLNQKSMAEKRLNDFSAAKKTLSLAIQNAPEYAASYNHLALLYYREANYETAETLFIKALEVQTDYVDALYNLALCYRAQNKTADCAAALKSIVDVRPKHLPAHFLLAKLFLETENHEKAYQRFAMIADVMENDLDVLLEIIRLLLEHQRFLEAEPFCQAALIRCPKDHRLIYNLAVIAEKKGELELAMKRYLDVLQLKPDSFEALNNLGVLYIETQQPQTAKFYLEKALALRPDNKPLQHTLAAISGDQSVKAASSEYIANLFDQYADHFETHLLTSLEYQVPHLLDNIIQKQLAPKEKSLTCLDLGCGTGLMGEKLKRHASTLTGVDLSQKMLAIAKEKQLYDQLACMDITTYLAKHRQRFDLITAADVFVYQGDLDEIFNQASLALIPGGYFLFSTEEAAGEDFLLSKSGRFFHSPSYIHRLAENHGFTLLHEAAAATRKQRHEAAPGRIYLLKKNG